MGDFSVESFSDGPIASRMISGVDAGVYGTTANEQVHEINDIVPNCKAKKIKTSFGQLFGGGYANVLFADGSARRVNDNNGYGGAQRGDTTPGVKYLTYTLYPALVGAWHTKTLAHCHPKPKKTFAAA